MRKWIPLWIMLAMLGLAACSSRPLAYRPAAFGENGHCYYAQSPLETQMLFDQGLCDRSWVPMLMPSLWHQRYYNYYSSPAYYTVYVPAGSRSTYQTSESTFGSTNRSAINQEAPKATYKGSNGKTVTADKIGAAKYGAGARFGPAGTKFGGGSARNGTSGTTSGGTKSGGSTGTKSGTTGGGSKSGGSTGGGTKSGGGSFGGGSGRSGGGSFGGGGGRGR